MCKKKSKLNRKIQPRKIRYCCCCYFLITIQIYDIDKMARNRDSKIDVSTVRNHFTVNSINEYYLIDHAQIFHDFISKELPPERINGIVNLMVAVRPASDDKDVENALVKKM